MIVLINGKEVERKVDYVDRCERTGICREVPCLEDGEEVTWTICGKCIVYEVQMSAENHSLLYGHWEND